MNKVNMVTSKPRFRRNFSNFTGRLAAIILETNARGVYIPLCETVQHTVLLWIAIVITVVEGRSFSIDVRVVNRSTGTTNK